MNYRAELENKLESLDQNSNIDVYASGLVKLLDVIENLATELKVKEKVQWEGYDIEELKKHEKGTRVSAKVSVLVDILETIEHFECAKMVEEIKNRRELEESPDDMSIDDILKDV